MVEIKIVLFPHGCKFTELFILDTRSPYGNRNVLLLRWFIGKNPDMLVVLEVCRLLVKSIHQDPRLTQSHILRVYRAIRGSYYNNLVSMD